MCMYVQACRYTHAMDKGKKQWRSLTALSYKYIVMAIADRPVAHEHMRSLTDNFLFLHMGELVGQTTILQISRRFGNKHGMQVANSQLCRAIQSHLCLERPMAYERSTDAYGKEAFKCTHQVSIHSDLQTSQQTLYQCFDDMLMYYATSL